MLQIVAALDIVDILQGHRREFLSASRTSLVFLSRSTHILSLAELAALLVYALESRNLWRRSVLISQVFVRILVI